MKQKTDKRLMRVVVTSSDEERVSTRRQVTLVHAEIYRLLSCRKDKRSVPVNENH